MAGDGDGDGGKRITRYSDFVKVHWLLLAASGLPQSLHFQLFQKLNSETFDGGAHFSIEPTSDGRQRRLLLTSSDMSKESQVFLIDHAWTFRLSDAYKQLPEVSGLAERMAALMCVDVDLNSNAEEETEEVVDGISHQNGTKLSVFEAMESVIHGAKENGDGAVRWLELDELDIDDDTFLSLDLSTRFPGLLALSLCGNKLENVEIIAREVTKFEQLRALWLNNNPVVKNCDSQLENRVLQGLPRLEIYNSRFTAKFGAWALGFCGGVYGKDNPGSVHEGDHQLESVSSLDLSDRCIHNLISKNVQKGDECTRDFLFGIGEDKQRSARLSAWFHTPQNFFIKEYEKHCKKLQSKSLISPSIQSSTTRSIHHTDGSPLLVYTDLPHVEEFLTRSEFVIISKPKDADIVWTSTQVDEDMKKAAGITDQQYINQFPFKACLVMKHHLAETVHKRPDRLALNLNAITSYTERHVDDTGPVHLVSGVEEMISIFNWRYQERYMSHQFDHYMTYLGQNDQQNSTTVFDTMDTDKPSVQHESSMEEDTKMDGDVLPASHSNGEVDKEGSKNDENDRLPESNSSEENMTE